MAWLSDAQHSPFQDFDHGPETASLPYVLPNGVRIADNWDDLALNGPGDGITVTETGEPLIDKRPEDKSRIGRNAVPNDPVDVWIQWDAERQWTNYQSAGCHLKWRLYCVEQ